MWDRLTRYNFDEIMASKVWEGMPDVAGKRVFIKPNLVTPPTRRDWQSVTSPLLVEALLVKVLEKKPSEIVIGCCGFKGQWEKTIELWNKDLLSKFGWCDVKLICVQEGENYHKYTLIRFPHKEDYLSLYGVKVSNFVIEADVVINVPKLKVHTMAGMTGAIKNMMGVISPKGTMHPNGSSEILHKRLRDLYALLNKRVSWVLMDGIVGAEYSEQFGVPRKANILISGTDMFEVDCLGAYAIGYYPEEIDYLRYIHNIDKKPWPDLEPLNYNRVFFEKPLTWR